MKESFELIYLGITFFLETTFLKKVHLSYSRSVGSIYFFLRSKGKSRKFYFLTEGQQCDAVFFVHVSIMLFRSLCLI